jgi:hypothetical protein
MAGLSDKRCVKVSRYRLLLLPALLGSVMILTHCDSGPPPGGGPTYRELGCNLCHGEGREGTEMGPSLQAVHEHWTPEKLSTYLEDPESYLSTDERLKAISTRFSAHMPQLPMTEEQKRLVIEFILKSR